MLVLAILYFNISNLDQLVGAFVKIDTPNYYLLINRENLKTTKFMVYMW